MLPFLRHLKHPYRCTHRLTASLRWSEHALLPVVLPGRPDQARAPEIPMMAEKLRALANPPSVHPGPWMPSFTSPPTLFRAIFS